MELIYDDVINYYVEVNNILFLCLQSSSICIGNENLCKTYDVFIIVFSS
jgi:hypothetical protein